MPQDLALGIRYALASAPAGDINGQVLLARSFYFGRGVPKDLVESARWFRKAAQQVCRPGAEDLQQPDLAEAARSIKD